MPNRQEAYPLTSTEDLFHTATRLLLERGSNEVDGTYLIAPFEPYGSVLMTDNASIYHPRFKLDYEGQDAGPGKRRLLELGDPIIQLKPAYKLPGQASQTVLARTEALSEFSPARELDIDDEFIIFGYFGGKTRMTTNIETPCINFILHLANQ